MGIIHEDLNLKERLKNYKYYKIFKEMESYTMIAPATYIRNLKIAEKFSQVDGDIVECGVWKGGMIAGVAKLLNTEKTFYLYDSFEGLPEAKDVDGDKAINYQKNKEAKFYFDNCSIEEHFAKEAMQKSQTTNYKVVKGWFDKTLPGHKSKISILRLDADWYESTMVCLENLYDKLSPGGVIMVDDYYVWDGCTRAIHDYLAKYKLQDRIFQFDNDVMYIVKSNI